MKQFLSSVLIAVLAGIATTAAVAIAVTQRPATRLSSLRPIGWQTLGHNCRRRPRLHRFPPRERLGVRGVFRQAGCSKTEASQFGHEAGKQLPWKASHRLTLSEWRFQLRLSRLPKLEAW